MALAFFYNDIDEKRKQSVVKNLAKPEYFGRELKANLTMEEVEASEVEDFAIF